MRIAQISDLHLGSPTCSPMQFFSKRWLGNFNLLLARRKSFAPERLQLLPELFESLKIDYVLVTGDVSITSRRGEFQAAQDLCKKFEERKIKVAAIPGNHDHYTRSAFRKKTFYDYFPASYDGPHSLKEEGLAVKILQEGWHLIALDTALATSWVSSQGLFSEKLGEKLEKVLSGLPEGGHAIVMNHFPLFNHLSPRKALIGAGLLQEILRKHPRVLFYLHGHSHIHCIADLRNDSLPIILDSGSTSFKNGGRWNLIDIAGEQASVEVFSWEQESWKGIEKKEFSWIPGIKRA